MPSSRAVIPWFNWSPARTGPGWSCRVNPGHLQLGSPAFRALRQRSGILGRQAPAHFLLEEGGAFLEQKTQLLGTDLDLLAACT